MKKVAIIGSRGYPRLDLVGDFVAEREGAWALVTGGIWQQHPYSSCPDMAEPPPGVDEAAVRAARERGVPVVLAVADFDYHGRSAGPRRNRVTVAVADEVVAFWDGKSRGTLDTMRKAQRAGKLRAVFGADGVSLDTSPQAVWRTQ